MTSAWGQHAGWDEIARLKDLLEEDMASLGGQCEVLPLHSMVPSADQRRVFKRSSPGERKVWPRLLSTLQNLY